MTKMSSYAACRRRVSRRDACARIVLRRTSPSPYLAVGLLAAATVFAYATRSGFAAFRLWLAEPRDESWAAVLGSTVEPADACVSQRDFSERHRNSTLPPAKHDVVVLRALDWTQLRVRAFAAAVMGGGALGSGMPASSLQMEPYELDLSFSDAASIAARGILLTPAWAFSPQYDVHVNADIAQWMDAAAGHSISIVDLPLLLASTSSAASLLVSCVSPRMCRDTRASPLEGFSTMCGSVWAAAAGIRQHTIVVNEVASPFLPDSHARALASCVVDLAPTGQATRKPLFRDRRPLKEAIAQQGRYPLLSKLLMQDGTTDAALAAAMFRPAAAQPVPQVATFFNVIVGATGFIYSRRVGGVRRSSSLWGAASRFMPIQCTYRESDKLRAGSPSAIFKTPVRVVDEMIVLSQLWSEYIFHVWQEQYSRLAPLLAFAHSRPDIFVHIKLHDEDTQYSSSNAWALEALDVLGISRSRAVWGPIEARVVHVPEGTPCGEPYAWSQVVLREVLRTQLGLPSLVDIWGDGATVRGVQTLDSLSAEQNQDPSSSTYLRSLNKCVAHRYEAAAQGFAAHPAASILKSDPIVRSALRSARPVIIVVERRGQREITNSAALIAALSLALPRHEVRAFGPSGAGSQRDNLLAFADAVAIIGPHGAGLTNAIISPPGTLLLEFLPERGLTNLVYTQMALLLGADYTSYTPTGGDFHGSFTVDIARVVSDVQKMLLTQR